MASEKESKKGVRINNTLLNSKEEISKENKDITLVEYERIGNLTLRLDKYSTLVLSFFITAIFVAFLCWFLLSQPFVPFTDSFFSNIILIWGFIIGIFLSFILIILYMALTIFARINELFRRYNKDKVVKLFFYELAGDPSDKRIHEIMTHLLYNISRIRKEYVNSRVAIMRTLHWSYYNRIRNEKRKLIIQTINNLIDYLGSHCIFSENSPESQFLKTTGDYIEKRDYLNLAKELKEKNKLFEKNWELFETDEKITFRGYIKKSLYGIEWISKYGNGLIQLILVLVILYFLWKGYITTISIP